MRRPKAHHRTMITLRKLEIELRLTHVNRNLLNYSQDYIPLASYRCSNKQHRIHSWGKQVWVVKMWGSGWWWSTTIETWDSNNHWWPIGLWMFIICNHSWLKVKSLRNSQQSLFMFKLQIPNQQREWLLIKAEYKYQGFTDDQIELVLKGRQRNLSREQIRRNQSLSMFQSLQRTRMLRSLSEGGI